MKLIPMFQTTYYKARYTVSVNNISFNYLLIALLKLILLRKTIEIYNRTGLYISIGFILNGNNKS